MIFKNGIGKLILFFLSILPLVTAGQQYDVLIKNGHVIDPRNKIDSKMDVAIQEGKIARVASDIPANSAKRVVNAKGLYVCPGLIDIHTHVFVGPQAGTFANGFSSVSPDDFSFKSGVTTVVDAGTSGWRNFPDFKAQVIDQSKTRVLAFLNIAGSGMQGKPMEEDRSDMDAKKTAETIAKYPDIIVGVKIGHFTGKERTPFERALEAGRQADVPLLVECHLPEIPLEELLDKMSGGDIFTHAFGNVNDRTSIIDEKGQVEPYVMKAREKGIRFDVGHGGGSFHFSEAIPAARLGFWPDSFGTDLHRFSMNSGMKNMLDIMSKFLNMGMPLEMIIDRASWNAAQTIKREDLGHLSEGSVADVAILRIRKGKFGFIDSGGNKIKGKHNLEAEMTIRAGQVVWDLNGIGRPVVEQ